MLLINIMNNISADCDCVANPSEPDMHDIGILASTDPVALDQACVDLAICGTGRRVCDQANAIQKWRTYFRTCRRNWSWQQGIFSKTNKIGDNGTYKFYTINFF